MLRITYDKYDQAEERFEKLKTPAFLPSESDLQQVEKFEKKDKTKYENFMLLMIYCHEKSPAMKDLSEEDQVKKKRLQDFIYNRIEFVD